MKRARHRVRVLNGSSVAAAMRRAMQWPEAMQCPCLWQFKAGSLGVVRQEDWPGGVIYSAWDRQLGRRVYYQP